MTQDLVLNVPGAELHLDPALGTLWQLAVTFGSRRLDVLHRAPWLNEPEVQGDMTLAPVERRLAGDFFCAPFADVGEAGVIHGWPANSAWQVNEITRTDVRAVAQLTLEHRVQGAEIVKTVQLDAGQPLVYQTHRISGGAGGLSVGHHPMVWLSKGGWLSFSPKQRAVTPQTPLEPGRGWLAYPAQSDDLSAFPGAHGPVDLHRYPDRPGHEDFVLLAEAAGSTLGWTVVIRQAEDDLIFVLKDPAVLPVTMLWYSNGGRDHAPWNGRHFGVLGIEDGCASGAGGLAEAQGPNAVTALGLPSVLPLCPGLSHEVRHVIGAAPRPAGWQRVTGITLGASQLTLHEAAGGSLDIPFDTDFFSRA